MIARLFALALAAAAAVVPAGMAQDAAPGEEPRLPLANGVAAVVEDEIITVERVRRELEPLLPQLRLQAKSPAEFTALLARLQREVLQSQVDRLLLVKEFDSKELRIPASFIENEYDEVLASDFEGDRARFLAYLKERGMTPAEFRLQLTEDIKVGYMRGQMMRSQTVVSPVRIEEYYAENREQFLQEDAVRLRLIRLSRLTDEGDDVLQQQAEQIVARLDAGTPFADLAREYSQDSRRDRGGDWGWLTRGSLQPALDEVAFTLSPGQHSPPIRVGADLFILQIDERKYAGHKPISEVRPEIERILASENQREAQERTMQRLREKYYVRYFL